MRTHNPHATREFRKSLRGNPTPSEVLLWDCLKGRRCEGFKFRRQHGIGPFILDFYCPELRLAIELDGSVHEDLERASYDDRRDRFLKSQGIEVLHVPNNAVVDDGEATLAYLAAACHRRAEAVTERKSE